MSHGLSKSKIIHGIQCPKRLWLEIHRPELAKYSEKAAQFLQAGNDAHRAYRELVPDGILVGHVDNLKSALEQTRIILNAASGTPILEGAFQHKGVLVRADLIVPDSKDFRLVEVKAAGSVKNYHFQDCAIQTWVIERAGISIRRVELAFINTSFVYPGKGDYGELFKHKDMTKAVRTLMKEVPSWIKECQTILAAAMPVTGIGDQCQTPYDCPFNEYCSEYEPTYPVRCLPNRGKIVKELIAEGIPDIRDIPEGRLTKPLQERVRRVTKSGKAEINSPAATVLKKFPYPGYYLDFETVAFAVPRWPGTRPYQPLPFQWSCHIEHANGKIEHKWFLDTSGEAPMKAAAYSLVGNLVDSGPIFMYTPYEKRIINDLMAFVPDLASKLKAIMDRLVDLKPIVKDHYYHPDMKGSWSLKDVMACIAPEMSHARLDEVTDGMAAQRAYQEIIAPETDHVRRENLEKKLLDYCELRHSGNGQDYKAFAGELKLFERSDFSPSRWPKFFHRCAASGHLPQGLSIITIPS